MIEDATLPEATTPYLSLLHRALNGSLDLMRLPRRNSS